ncbi:conserved hypothetical protein [Candidatus Magnetomoraceae bacterium gMMP-15]
MNSYFKPIKLKDLKSYSIFDRKSKVNTSEFASSWKKNGSFRDFLAGLPNILAASDILYVIDAIVKAYNENKTIILAMGAHVIKVGLNPVLIDLMERGIITSIAINGAGIIHDSELAIAGMTSEDVNIALTDGSFGMARETSAFLSDAIKRAKDESIGLGMAVGKHIIDQNLPYVKHSLLATGARLNIPITVHIAIGTDIIHVHPDFDAGAAGKASHLDFRTFASVVSSLKKGVYMNVGSAVILPEVFLKALTLVRNLGYSVNDFTAVNMDFIRSYRPMTNVVNRPTSSGGKGINLIGHHEIMLPLIAAGVIEKL